MTNHNIQLPSNLKFGLLFSGIFLAAAGYEAIRGIDVYRPYFWLMSCVIIALIAAFKPNLLTPEF